MKKFLSLLLVVLFVTPFFAFAEKSVTPIDDSDVVTEGELITLIGWENDPNAFSQEDPVKTQALPLKHTSVSGEISGFVARTTVTQEFQNPYKQPIEAIYRFPLPHGAAVDSMIMQIGDRKIIGKIDTRKEAERKYQEAKQQGKTAALLNQERPNIFTQKIANILPGDSIKITISYFEVLAYDNWQYTYVFPMVVGPRYNPASVVDAGNIESPTIKAGNRNGHTIDLRLAVRSGVAIRWLKSNSHEVNVVKVNDTAADITLKNADEIPNKDFSFVFNVASDEPQIGFMTYKKKAEKDGYFVLLAEPQKSPKKSEIRNKEIVFVLDTSGSMGGRPIETVKKAMRKAIENLGPNDYFNIYNFNTSVYSLFPTAQKASAETQKSGLAFVDKLVAGGGTIMLEPFKEALKDNGDHADRMRIILGMTDGDVGNDDEILNLVSSGLGNNRLFMLGVDAAANRYLIEKMAASGNGKATFVLREDDVEKKVDEFYANFAAPVLTDIQVSWGGLNVTDILPSKFADLYAGQPLIVAGKYSADNLDTTRDIIIKAKRGNEDYTQTIKVNFPSESLENSSIAAYWARQKIDNVLRESAFVPNLALEEMITALGLNYGIMTQYTSFIAIDETVRNASGSSQTVEVPVYEVEGKDYSLINGTSYEMGTRGGQSYQKSSSNMPLLSLQSSNSYTDSVGLNETKRSPGSLTNQNNINPTPSKARIDKVVEGVSWNQLVLSILGIIIVILGVFAFLFKKRK